MPRFKTLAKASFPRHKRGEMNKTEARFAQHLELLQRAGEVLWWKFEHIKLRLADATFYDVDFFAVNSDSELVAYEVKGFWRDDAKVKIKVAQEIYPFKFIAVTEIKGGGWKEECFFREEV